MSETDPYEKLRRKMNLFPLKVPKTKKFHKMLELLYTPEEAEILSIFGMPYIDEMRITRFARKANKPEDEIREMFESLVKRGLLFKRVDKKGRSLFMLAPYIPGIFEFYFMSKADPPEKMKEVAEVLEDYFFETFAPETFNSGFGTYPFFRVLPHQKAVEKVIELDEEVPSELQILPFELVSQYISSAERIAVGICPCRDHAEIVDGKARCDKPRDVCMVFEKVADYWVEKGIARYVDQKEAMEVLRKAEEAGLVHNTTNNILFGPELPGMICNCCPCCCFIMQGLRKVNRPRGIAQSNFNPQIERDLCKLCNKCVEICPMEAIFHHPPHLKDLSDNFFYIAMDKCIGCGVCASNCPHNAITLKKVRPQIPVKTAAAMCAEYEQKRLH